MKQEDEILIHDCDFPQIYYYIGREELIKLLEDNNKPKWWLEMYRKLILESNK